MYDIILADPCWHYYNSGIGKTKHVNEHYATMTNEQIYQMDLGEYLNHDGVLFVWATGPKLGIAIQAIQQWGLFFRGVAFNWIKTTKTGKPLNGCGVRPSVVKPITEYLLWASHKPKGRPRPLAIENAPNQVLAPREGHSVKPEIFQTWIERMYPNTNKLELFARRQRDGWICTGLELDGTDYTKGIIE